MEKQKELISYLKQISNNNFTAVVLITSGIMGLFLSNISLQKLLFLTLVGAYFDFLFFRKYSIINSVIERIIKEMK